MRNFKGHTFFLSLLLLLLQFTLTVRVIAQTNLGPATANAQLKTINKLAAANNDVFGTQASFIENVGQYGDGPAAYQYMGPIEFGFQGFAMPVFFTKKGIFFLEQEQEAMTEKERDKLEKREDEGDKEEEEKSKKVSVATMQWLNANPDVQIIAEDVSKSYFSFGTLKNKARAYKRITYKELYPGVDITFYFDKTGKTGFEYNITLHPGANLSNVKMLFGGDIKKLKSLSNGDLKMLTEVGGFQQSQPISFYEGDSTHKIKFSFRRENNVVGFYSKELYDTTKTIVIDPFVSSTSNLVGLNTGKAKDIDFDYAGNLYVSGGGDGGTNHMIAKYDANGVLQWSFSGILTNPSWQFGTYYGGWVVEKNTGSIYLGQGFEYLNGFSIIRLTTAGIYDNYITTANPNFREDWKMYWSCNNGSPQILIAGGGTNSNTNFGICTPPSTTISALNITGIPYTGVDGWAQDISDIVIDPVTNDMYTIYGSLYGTPALSNKIFKNTAPYSAGSIGWSLYSGFVAIQEIANRPFLAGSNIDNSSNVLAVNSSYFFYWDGKNLKAFDKLTGNTVGTPLTIPANINLMSGGIIADECNNIFVGSTKGTIKVYKFNGATFDDGAANDINVPGYSNSSVYDLAYNESQKLIYASGDGFIGAFDVSSYGCISTSYTLSVNANCGTGTASVNISPAPPVGSTITYVLYDGNTQIASNSTGVFTGLSAGINYTVKVYVNQTCSGSLTTISFVLPGPTISVSTTDASCGNTTGSITANGSGSIGPYSYSKDGVSFQGSGLFTGMGAGVYIITVKDGGGCKSADTVTINNSNGPVLTYTKSDATCSGNNGTITASATGGQAPLQYSINGVTYQLAKIFTGLVAGNYTLIVKDANGCTNASSVNIIDFPSPQLTATPIAATCGNSNGSITTYGTGGRQPLQYSIDGNNFQSGNFFENLSAGGYTVYVKDANGCLKTLNVTVTNSPVPSVTVVTTPAACNNFNGSITATGTGGISPLQYSIDGVFFQASNVFSGLAPGVYTVTVQDINGCSSSIQATVSSSNGPVASAVSTPATCVGNNGTITASATGTGPFQYSINGFIFQAGNLFTGLVAGNYIVYVKDVFGCINTASIAVVATSGPQLSAIATPASCNINDGTITITGSGGTGQLSYSIDGISYQPGYVFTGLSEGIYTVTVKDALGCYKSTTVNILNASGLSVTASSISTTCTGDNGTVTAISKGGVAPIQFSINGANFQSNNVFTGLLSGNYTVTAKDANGCTVETKITVGAISSANISVTKTNANCNNNNGTINATATGGVVPYQFSIDGVNFQSSGSFINVTPSTYSVTVKDANGCINSTSATIVNVGNGPAPQIVVKKIDPSFCGNNEGRIQVTANGGTGSLDFSIDGVNFQGSGTFNKLPPGDYVVTVRDANGCTSSKVVTVPDIGAPTLTATSTSTPCGTSNGSITAVGSGGTKPYKYNINGGILQASGTFNGLSAGTYIIGIKDAEGCTTFISVTVLNTGGPTVSASKTDGTCGLSNGTITAVGTGGSGTLSFNINGGLYQQSGLFTGLSAGTYSVTVKDVTGCTSGVSVVINNPGAPIFTLNATAASCNTNNGKITILASGGKAPLRYSIDGTIFQSINFFDNLAPGVYTITVLDAAGCSDNATITVGKAALPKVSAFTINASCGGSDGTIVANGANGVQPYQYAVDGLVFQTSNTFIGLSAGFYNITVKDANGCINTTGIALANTAAPLLSINATSATCDNSNGVITASGSGGTAPLQFSIDGINFQGSNTFSSLSSGLYTITEKDANGCINSKSILVGNLNGPQQLTAKVVSASCESANGSIIAATQGGTLPLQYSIDGSNFQSSNTFSGILAGSYTLIVKDANGCTKSLNLVVTNLVGPSVIVNNATTSCSTPDAVLFATATGGTAPLQYSIDGTTYQAGNVFSGVGAGTYTVSVKDANGCIGTTTVTVSNSGAATVTAGSITASCGNSNGSITAIATGG
ncbi:beta strand repeat-containing protein, partial [Limnovirga soli]